MTAPNFFVSAIIPVYNGEAFLAEAAASIQRQRVDALEIIIVNDGSTDGTAEVIESLQGTIRSASQPNRGPAAARSRGVRMAQGNVIAFLDADDLWPEDKLEIQLAQREVTLRHLTHDAHEHRPLGPSRREQSRAIGFRRAAELAPEIELPRGQHHEAIGVDDRRRK